MKDIEGFAIHATDGILGIVKDFGLWDAGIYPDVLQGGQRYFIVKTNNWWLGHSVLIAPEWVDDVYWEESKLVVAMIRQTLKNSPEYDSKVSITRENEEILHAFYGHKGYWPTEASHDSHRAYNA